MMEQEHMPNPQEKTEPVSERQEAAELKRHPDEGQAAYLSRAGKAISSFLAEASGEGRLFRHKAIVKETDIPEAGRQLIAEAMEQARRGTEIGFSPDNSEALASVEKNISGHSTKAGNEAEFDQTERDRRLFDPVERAKGRQRETYWNTLVFPYATEAARGFAKELLDDKAVVLLGGGKSALAGEMERYGIHPKDVVNVDPFVSRSEAGADPIISASASAENLLETLRDTGVEKADEIWATFSVPAYAESPEEIRQLFRNIDGLLAEGGNARIWPTMVKNLASEAETQFLARKQALMEALKALDGTGRYEIVPFVAEGRDGFTLHKLPERADTPSALEQAAAADDQASQEQAEVLLKRIQEGRLGEEGESEERT